MAKSNGLSKIFRLAAARKTLAAMAMAHKGPSEQ
jgi:hypothetical protein